MTSQFVIRVDGTQHKYMFHAILNVCWFNNVTNRHPNRIKANCLFQQSKHCPACIMKLRQAKNQVFTTIWGQLIFNKTAGHNTQCQGFWLEIFRLRTVKKLCTWAAAAERVPGQPQLLAICGIALSTMLKGQIQEISAPHCRVLWKLESHFSTWKTVAVYPLAKSPMLHHKWILVEHSNCHLFLWNTSLGSAKFDTHVPGDSKWPFWDG